MQHQLNLIAAIYKIDFYILISYILPARVAPAVFTPSSPLSNLIVIEIEISKYFFNHFKYLLLFFKDSSNRPICLFQTRFSLLLYIYIF